MTNPTNAFSSHTVLLACGDVGTAGPTIHGQVAVVHHDRALGRGRHYYPASALAAASPAQAAEYDYRCCVHNRRTAAATWTATARTCAEVAYQLATTDGAPVLIQRLRDMAVDATERAKWAAMADRVEARAVEIGERFAVMARQAVVS